MIASVYGLFCYRDMFWSWSTCWLPSLILYFFSLYSRHKALNFTYITSELDFFFSFIFIDHVMYLEDLFCDFLPIRLLVVDLRRLQNVHICYRAAVVVPIVLFCLHDWCFHEETFLFSSCLCRVLFNLPLPIVLNSSLTIVPLLLT